MDVGHNSSDHVVVLDQTATGGLLHHVEHLFTIAESVEKGGQRSKVHTQCRPEQQVRRQAVQLIHNRTDVQRPFGNLDAHRLFDTHTERVTVLMCGKIIQPIGQGQRLRIGQTLTHLLDTPMDVSAIHIDLLDNLTLERYPKTEHPVCGGVLRAYIDHIFRIVEQYTLRFFDLSVLLLQSRHDIERLIALQPNGIDLRRGVIIFPERVPHPIVSQIETTHIGITDKTDPVKIVHLTFIQMGRLPQVADTLQLGIFAVRSLGTQHDLVSELRRTQVINDS